MIRFSDVTVATFMGYGHFYIELEQLAYTLFKILESISYIEMILCHFLVSRFGFRLIQLCNIIRKFIFFLYFPEFLE